MNFNRNLVKQIALEDVYNDYLESGGIFTDMMKLYTLPWAEHVDAYTLDIEYYTNHSGGKLVSPLIEKLLTTEGLTQEKRNVIAKIVYLNNILNWTGKWKTMFYEYNPIENYDRTEEWTDSTLYGKTIDETGTTKNQESGKDTFNKKGKEKNTVSGSDTNTKSGNETNEISGKETSTNSKYAYNSSSWNNDNKSELEFNNRNNKTTYNNVTDSNNYSSNNTLEFENRADETNYGKIDDYNRNLKTQSSGKDDLKHTGKIHGNIGVMSTQTMINMEREVWDWKFFEEVFKDIDNILTIGTFADCDRDGNYIDHIDMKIPMASSDKLGAVKANKKLDNQNKAVGIDDNGFLYVDALSSTEAENLYYSKTESDAKYADKDFVDNSIGKGNIVLKNANGNIIDTFNVNDKENKEIVLPGDNVLSVNGKTGEVTIREVGTGNLVIKDKNVEILRYDATSNNETVFNLDEHVPNVYNNKITIGKEDGTEIGSFNLNQDTDKTIIIPTGSEVVVNNSLINLKNDNNETIGSFTLNQDFNQDIVIPTNEHKYLEKTINAGENELIINKAEFDLNNANNIKIFFNVKSLGENTSNRTFRIFLGDNENKEVNIIPIGYNRVLEDIFIEINIDKNLNTDYPQNFFGIYYRGTRKSLGVGNYNIQTLYDSLRLNNIEYIRIEGNFGGDSAILRFTI